MDTDRNLLFGVLALQADLLNADRFARACALWAADKNRPLADVLIEQGWLTPGDRADVEKLLQRKLAKHGGDARASLAEITAAPIRQSLAGLADPDVRQSLAGLTPQPQGHILIATTDYVPEARERYTLSRLHATGGIGRVWVARDARVGRDVALKELRPERSGRPEVWGRFLREAQITGQLEHPGIVPVYEVGTRPDGQGPFYTMRFVRGRTLAEAVATHHQRRQQGQVGPLELRELLTAFVGVCQAVAYAHSRGIIHRDLKPQNVVLGDYGEVIVLDWGLAKVLHDNGGQPDSAPASTLALGQEGSRDETVAGQVLGTPAYMPPEQAEGRRDLLGARADVYGLGATLYEILAGQPPYTGDDTAHVLRRVVHEPPAPPRAVVPGTPRPLEAVCLKALAKQPAERYATAKELAVEIQHWLADEPVSAYREPLWQRLGRWRRRHPTLAAISVLVLFSLVASSVVVFNLVRREQDRARALGQADALADAEPAAVPGLLADLAGRKDLTLARLREKWADSTLTDRQRLRVGLTLADDPEVRAKLIDLAAAADDPQDVLLVREGLRPHAGEVVPALWAKAARSGSSSPARFRILLILAGLDPEGPQWARHGSFAAEQLLAVNPLQLATCQRALEPVRSALLPPLREAYRTTRTGERGLVAAAFLSEYAADRPEVLVDALLDATPAQFAVLWPRVRGRTGAAVLLLRAELAKPPLPETNWPARDVLARRQAQAAVALMQLGYPNDTWPLLLTSADPSRRSYLIHLLGQLRTDPAPILHRLETEPSPSARAALILCLGEFPPELLPAETRAPVVARLLSWYRDDPDSGVHSAIDWLLRHGTKGPAPRVLNWAQGDALRAIDRELTKQPPGAKGWYVEVEGHSLAVVRGPVEFTMGSPATEPDRRQTTESPIYRRRIPRSFAIGTREVTIAQFKRFKDATKQSWSYAANYSPDPEGGAIGVTWYDAAEYCNWLSEQAGIPESEWVYPKGRLADQMMMPDNFLSRKGYRLPTEAEWEYACRARTTSPRFYGFAPSLTDEYAWWYKNSEDQSWPGGQLKPNDSGLFDTTGNVLEWCQDRQRAYPANPKEGAVDDLPGLLDFGVPDSSLFARTLRGGSFGSRMGTLRSAARLRDRPGTRFDSVGLRVARTIE